MRPGKGCASCRKRHLKCVTDAGNIKCTRCSEAGRDCTFRPRYRFRHVTHVDGSSHQADGARQELRYARDQKWVSKRTHYSFIIEDGTGLEYGVPDDEESAQPATDADMPVATAELPRRGAPISGLLSPAVPSEVPRNHHGTATIDNMLIHEADPGHDLRAPRLSPCGPSSQSSETPRPENGSSRNLPDFSSPASIDELAKRHEDHVDTTCSAFPGIFPVGSTDEPLPASLPTPGSIPKLNLSRREGFLIQHFINKVGPWFDVCDLSMQFTHELPRRAMHKPMVLYAILALTSRHLAILSSKPEPAEASFYHGQCLRLVIDQLSGPESHYDDNLLATVVCLRVYEEIESTCDQHLHLDGTGRLLHAIPRFAHSGGLGEAACWQALRQDIYISLTRSVAPSFRLELFDQSSAFTIRDDGACANVVVLLFAQILRLTYGPQGHDHIGQWSRLKLDVEAWNDRRCSLFQPIYYEDFDVAKSRPTPIIHMISPPQVAAMQYYHACKIFLLIHAPEVEVLTGFSAAKKRRALERDVTFHLAAIIGLAESNPFVENANFTAHHLLRVAGYCITNIPQRRHVLSFLRQVEKVMGWSTVPTRTVLESQWNDLDCPND